MDLVSRQRRRAIGTGDLCFALDGRPTDGGTLAAHVLHVGPDGNGAVDGSGLCRSLFQDDTDLANADTAEKGETNTKNQDSYSSEVRRSHWAHSCQSGGFTTGPSRENRSRVRACP